MPDILDTAQKQINDAANQLTPPAAAGSTPPPQPDPPAAPQPPVAAPTETKTKVAPEPTPEESAFVDKLIHETNTVSASPAPVPPAPIIPPPAPKKGHNKAMLISLLLFLFATLPLMVLFTSQQRQIADIRKRAATCTGGVLGLGGCCAAGKIEETVRRSDCSTYTRCERSWSACGTAGAPPPAATQAPASTQPPTGGGGAPQSTFNIDTAKCSPVGGIRTYSECCSLGKSRIVQATCLTGGREQFDIVSTCNDALPVGVCGTAAQSGPITGCKAGFFFWPKKDGGDDQCHDISAPPNPGGGTSNCSKSGGCTPPSGGCIKTYTCSTLTPQEFCLSGQQDGQANTNYQEQANATCQTIQVDAFTADQCASGISTTTPHSGTIIYHPNPDSPACKGSAPPPPAPTSPPQQQEAAGAPQPAATATPTPTQIAGPQCHNIKLYKNNEVVLPSALLPGDQVTVGIAGANATKARARVNGGTFTESTGTNAAGEFTLNFTIPNDVPNNSITIEAEVFQNGVWK